MNKILDINFSMDLHDAYLKLQEMDLPAINDTKIRIFDSYDKIYSEYKKLRKNVAKIDVVRLIVDKSIKKKDPAKTFIFMAVGYEWINGTVINLVE